MIQRLAPRHIFTQIYIVRRHREIGTIFLVLVAFICLRSFWEFYLKSCQRYWLVSIIVEIQLFNYVFNLGISDNIDDFNLIINIKVSEYLQQNALRSVQAQYDSCLHAIFRICTKEFRRYLLRSF